jgi:hypothetical protein
LIDAPTGPRASNYPSEFRSDFNFRGGDFRGDRGGRGRGRAWREDSRDRGREVDRDYRDRRDDRPPVQFRDDRGGRERWNSRESFRGGRRPSSPQGRGRSPNYGQRDSRDAPPTLDIDRTRRGSRDGPLSGGSPSSDSLPYRGYGRGRGRGRGRGGAFLEDHRAPGRSRSPEPSWNRRTQPSATPPPQVPAFGSTSTNVALAVKPPTSPAAMTSSSTSGPVPGVSVPTAPRSLVANSQTQRSRHHNGSNTWVNPQLKGPNQSLDTSKSESSSAVGPSPGQSPPRKSYDGDAGLSPRSKHHPTSHGQMASDGPDHLSAAHAETLNRQPTPRRRPIIGKRAPKAPQSVLPDIGGDSSSDSGDDFDDDYFENEIAKIKSQIAEISKENPLVLRPELPAVFLRPFIESTIDDLVIAHTKFPTEDCVMPESKKEPVPDAPSISPSLKTKLIPENTGSRPTTPRPIVEAVERIPVSVIEKAAPDNTLGLELPSVDKNEQTPPAPAPPVSYDSPDGDHEVDDIDMPTAPTATPHAKLVTNGDESTVPSDSKGDMDCDDDEKSRVANLETLEAVRKYMATPPVSSLPNFHTKPWHEDEVFMASLVSRPEVEARIRYDLEDNAARRQREQSEERQKWKDRYLEYRRWTDFSQEDEAVRSRTRFKKLRAEAAAAAAAPHSSSAPTAGAKPEGGRRMGSRFATDHDIERVLRESEQEAKEKKEVEERAARAKTASAKEASITEMAWDSDEWNAKKFRAY